MDTTRKMVPYVGGIYGDKQQMMQRFVRVYRRLDPTIQKYLIIENGDRHYIVEGVLYPSAQFSILVVFDDLHHAIPPPPVECIRSEWFHLISDIWKEEDGITKIYFYRQDMKKRKGVYVVYIDADTLLEFTRGREGLDMDTMLKIEGKNISAIKCRNLLGKALQNTQAGWRRYRLLFLLDGTRLYEVWDTFMYSSCGI